MVEDSNEMFMFQFTNYDRFYWDNLPIGMGLKSQSTLNDLIRRIKVKNLERWFVVLCRRTSLALI